MIINVMVEYKFLRFLVTLRPQCGILKSEIQAFFRHLPHFNCFYLAHQEEADAGVQAGHVHIVMCLLLPQRKSVIKRSFVNACLLERIECSYERGFQIDVLTETNWMFHLGYIQKEQKVVCGNGFSEETKKIAYALYLETSKKRLKGTFAGCIVLKKSNVFAFIRDWRQRYHVNDPVICLKQMVETDHYICSFASLSQQCKLERYLAIQQPVPLQFIKHLIGDCSHTCPNCLATGCTDPDLHSCQMCVPDKEGNDEEETSEEYLPEATPIVPCFNGVPIT